MVKLHTTELLDYSFPEGVYWVGDPCYVFPNEEWGELCSLTFPKDYNGKSVDNDGAIWKYGKLYFFTCSTAYGDGRYPVYKGGVEIGQVGVDAGLLALVPINLIKKWGKKCPSRANGFDDGILVNINGDFDIGVFGDKGRTGNWSFADYEVITGENVYDEEDEEVDDYV